MSKIEDMALSSSGLIQDPLSLRTEYILLRKQRNWIEVSHHRDVVTNTLPRFIESHTPVESDHIATGFAHQFEQRRRSRTEVNYRNALRHIPNHALRMR